MRIPEGMHVAKALGWGAGIVNGKRVVAVAFGIMSGPARGEVIQWIGWTDDERVDKNGRTPRERTLATLDLCGVLGPDPGWVRIEVESDGKYDRVAWVNPLVRIKDPMAKAEAEAFIEALRRPPEPETEGSGGEPRW